MRVTDEIMANYQHLVGELLLTPSGGGVFDVTVDGETIYSKHDTGRHAEPGEVLTAFEALVPDGTLRYGT